MQKLKKIAAFSLTFLPMAALAVAPAFSGDSAEVKKITENITDIVNWAGPLLITVATIYFVWGVLQYITSGADEGKRAEARQTMIYGVIGLFVIVSVWGLISLIKGFTGLGDGGDAKVKSGYFPQ